MVVTALTTLVGVISLVVGKTKEATEAENEQSEALKEQLDKINENKNAWEDLKDTQQKQVNVGMSEMTHLENLYDELEQITEANGRVKQGYEKRASYILSTLNEALGTEYSMNGNLINQYSDLTKSIDKLMDKKKAEILLNSQEALYTEAKQKEQEVLQNIDDLREQIHTNEMLRKNEEFLVLSAQKDAKNAIFVWEKNQYLKQAEAGLERIKQMDNEKTALQNSLSEQQNLMAEYSYNIGVYEHNMAASHAEEYDKMISVNWDYVSKFKDAEDANAALLQDQKTKTQEHLNFLKELKEKSNSDLYDSQIKADEKTLEQINDTLKQYAEYTKLGLDATKVVWTGGLDGILSEITGANVEFKEDGKGNIDMYIDGVKQGDTKSKEEMAKIVSDTLKEVSKQDKDAKKAGEDLIEGVNNGVKNQDKQTSVFKSITNFGATLLSKLKASLKEKSPSKATNEMGQFLLQGLGLGMEEEEDSILKQASDFGKDVLSSINSGLSGKINTSAISEIKSNIPKYNFNTKNSSIVAQTENANMVDAFKTALSQMKIELDDEVAGKFVEKTVARAIYN